eukprot:2549596-Rhodomonas_salina.1
MIPPHVTRSEEILDEYSGSAALMDQVSPWTEPPQSVKCRFSKAASAGVSAFTAPDMPNTLFLPASSLPPSFPPSLPSWARAGEDGPVHVVAAAAGDQAGDQGGAESRRGPEHGRDLHPQGRPGEGQRETACCVVACVVLLCERVRCKALRGKC